VGLVCPASLFFSGNEFFWASPSSREDKAARKTCETAMGASISNPKNGSETETNENRSQVSSFQDTGGVGDVQVKLYAARLIVARNYLDKIRGIIIDTRT
jgi:hypothetical protein